MPKKKHNPNDSSANVIRYLIKDPEKNETVKKVRGQKEAIKWLEKLSREEKEPIKYRYLWQWEDPDAALEYDLEQLNAGQSKS